MKDEKDVLEFEEDEATLAEADEVEPIATGRRIFTEKLDQTVDQLAEQWRQGDLILDPLFQRRKVWEDSRASKLVESAILDVPLPIFYFAEEQDGRQEVIDGQQRLRAFFRYLDNEFELKSLKTLPELKRKRFRDLDKATQRKISKCALRTVIFKKESDEELRFEIFERLNTGAVPLNAQELRNCIYRGAYNQLLIDLSENADYMALMGFKGPDKRMKDVEYVLRFAAFYHSTHLKYKPPMARFLDEDMRTHRNIESADANEMQAAFKTSVSLIRSLLGSNAFRRFHRGTEDNPDGYWEPKKFNAALFDILMWGFASKDKNRVMSQLDAIREALIALMTEDQGFIDSIELSTSSLKMVTYRFDRWRNVLEAILVRSPQQQRCFSRALKKELYDRDPTCAICHQHIAEVDDAAVDHIEQYWLGGKTIPENARLAHRYCNWARPKSD